MSTLLRQVATWHRPMLWGAVVMAVMGVVSAGGLILDDRILLGAPIWLKPFKFSISIVLYFIAWAWLLSLLPTRRRLANGVSNVVVAILLFEYAIIILQVVRGRASHFNVATPFDSAMFSLMGTSIAVLWVGTLVLTVLLLRARIADAANRWAVRLGAVISLVGAGLGALMTSPTAEQAETMGTDSFEGMIGAHAVGVPDGGPGMPITGWSTTGGDLRIPHFVGMHALQALPLFALLLGLLATRYALLRAPAVRARLVLVAGGGYAALVGLVTWQALRGQPLIAPDGLTLAALGAIAVAMAAGVAWARAAPAEPGPMSTNPDKETVNL